MNSSNKYCYPNYSGEVVNRRIESNAFNTFLTNQPTNSIFYYSLNDIATADIIWDNSTPYLYSNEIGIICQTGSTYDSWVVSLIGGTSGYGFDTGTTQLNRISYGVGAWNINNIPLNLIRNVGSGLHPTVPIITENTTRYTVQGFKPLVFTKRTFCKKYYQIVFLNKWGAFDYYPVTGNYQPALNVERNSFEKKKEYAISDYEYGFSPLNRGTTVFDIKSNSTLKLFTDWLTLEQSRWLQEIFESPEVYLYSPTDNLYNIIDTSNFFPVDVLDTQIILPNERSSLKMFEINVALSTRRINQGN